MTFIVAGSNGFSVTCDCFLSLWFTICNLYCNLWLNYFLWSVNFILFYNTGLPKVLPLWFSFYFLCSLWFMKNNRTCYILSLIESHTHILKVSKMHEWWSSAIFKKIEPPIICESSFLFSLLSVCHSLLSVIPYCLPFPVVFHSPLSIVPHYLSFLLYVIPHCLQFPIVCHSSVCYSLLSVIFHCHCPLSFPIVCYFWISVLPYCLSIFIVWVFLLSVNPYCFSFPTVCH